MQQLVSSKYHERLDLTKKSGCKYAIMNLVVLNDDKVALVKIALYKKTYNRYIYKEIGKLRGRVNAAIKGCIIEGKHQVICMIL